MTITLTSRRPLLRRPSAAALLGLGLATPRSVPQELTAQLAATLNCQNAQQQAWLNRVFLRSGIAQRGSVLVQDDRPPLEQLQAFYPPPRDESDLGPTTAQRMARYEQAAPLLAQQAAGRALTAASVEPSQISHLITVSCTGFFSPGLDAALIERLNLPRGVQRLHIGFMGCHAACNALAAARNAALASPRARVLVCCVELCSLHFSYGWDPGKVVANGLFADAAAAAVIARAPAPTSSADVAWRLRDTTSFLIPDSPRAMTWRIGDHGFAMTLAPEVPALIGQHLRPWCESWLARHGLQLSDIAHWAIHPGGPKVLTAAAAALELPPDALRFSRAILAQHGNVSSGTLLFILHAMAKAGCSGPCVAIGLGPGLMAEGMLFNV